MQTGQPHNPTLPMPSMTIASPTQGAQCDHFVFNPDAQPFVPGVVPLAAMPEFIQDLHALWQLEAFSWESEERSCEFTTWLVRHPDDYKHRTRPRNVRLHEHFAVWEETIRNAWQILTWNIIWFPPLHPIRGTLWQGTSLSSGTRLRTYHEFGHCD